MIETRSASRLIFQACNAVLMAFLCVVTLYPLYYTLCASLSDPLRLMQNSRFIFAPLGWSVAAYEAVMRNPMISVGYRNTLMYLAAGTSLNMILTIFAAFGLSRKKLLLRNFFMGMIVVTMFFGGGLIPTYLLVRDLGLTNNRLAMILPGAVSAWNIIIMRTNFMTIPDSLEDAARIDGANDFRLLFRVILPLSMPVIAVMILFYGVGHWNAWFNAMIYLNKRDLFPLQLVLRQILIEDRTSEMTQGVPNLSRDYIAETIKYATIIVATVPVLVVYPFLQKYFTKGIMIGSLKE